MNAELILLVYHQLICMSDSDEIQERLSAEQRPKTAEDYRREFPAQYFHHPGPESLPPLGTNYEKVVMPHDEQIPPFTPVTPRDNRPKDTDKTIYRWNHVTDTDWNSWGYSGRRNWINHMIKKHSGKSVVA